MKRNTQELACEYIAGEVWKSYGNYFVSNYGRVYSCRYKRVMHQELKGNYYRINFVKKDKTKHIKTHRLTAMLFVPNPDNKPIVHHIDGNSLNNNADNLMWVTVEEHWEIHRKMRNARKVKQ